MLSFGKSEVTFALPAGIVTDVFARLSEGGCPLRYLVQAIQHDTSNFLSTQVHRLWSEGLIRQVLAGDSGVVASFTSVGATSFVPILPDLYQEYCWASTAYIRALPSWVTLESGESGASIVLNPRCEVLVNYVIQCANPYIPAASLQAATQQEMLVLTSWLLDSGFLIRASFVDMDNHASLCFTDKLMHARSRRGRHLGGYGATHRADGCPPSSPATPAPTKEQGIILPKPDLQSLCVNDRSLTSVMETRRSIRSHSETPIDRRALGEFLYRVARIREIHNNGDYEVATRPYPSGGALFSIETYILVNRCIDISKGLYRYDGVSHQLTKICEFTEDAQRLIAESSYTSGAVGDPHTLLILSARFQRVAWKYESIAYSLILKEVGVMYQTMYLVATAMDLAPCALGGGSSTLFSNLTGIDYWMESSVGEFLLGNKN